MFGIKLLREEVLRLAKEVKQLQCQHHERLHTYQCNLSGAANPAGNPAGAGPGRSLLTMKENLKEMTAERILSEWVRDGDLIKKVKGRWVHVRSGKMLKVKK